MQSSALPNYHIVCVNSLGILCFIATMHQLSERKKLLQNLAKGVLPRMRRLKSWCDEEKERGIAEQLKIGKIKSCNQTCNQVIKHEAQLRT